MKDVTKYDYDSLVERATDALKDAEGWGDTYPSSTGQTLIELLADMTDYLHYMLERRTLENFLTTAQLRSSVITRASEMGYRLKRIRGHQGNIRITLTDDDGNPKPVKGEVVIHAMTPILHKSNKYYIRESVTIPEGETWGETSIGEGEVVSKKFDLDRNPEILFTDYSDIDHDIFMVYNNGVQFMDVARDVRNINKRAMSFASADDPFYDIKYEVNGMRVVYGDGDFGKKMTGEVDIRYASIKQIKDPILHLGQEFKLNREVRDQHTNDVYGVKIENITTIVGGTEEESLESIKRNAVLYHKTNGRAVTNDDYAYWAMEAGIGGISDASAFGEEELGQILYNMNNVHIAYARSDGSEMSRKEEIALRKYFDNLKTSQAHVIVGRAWNYYLKLSVDMKKSYNLPISNAQIYSIIRDFLIDYFKVTQGSIGGEFQLSDLVRDMYKVKYSRHGVEYPVVDYLTIDADCVIPFNYPPKTTDVFVTIHPEYKMTEDDKWILIFDNLTCISTIKKDQTVLELLRDMRDVVRRITPLIATIEVFGVALDDHGYPRTIEIDPDVGYQLLMGVQTPYYSKDEVLDYATVGTSTVGVVPSAKGLTINHYYYSSRKGRRPMIPLRTGTRIKLQAPSDTRVIVKVRKDATNPSTETEFTIIEKNEKFEQVFDEHHSCIFVYENDSAEDRIAEIIYPESLGATFGLRVSGNEVFVRFDLLTSSGDLADYTIAEYDINTPKFDKGISTSQPYIKAGTVRIADEYGNEIFYDNGKGDWLTTSENNKSLTGMINYFGGKVSLPQTLENGKDYLMYMKQDHYGNLRMGKGDLLNFIPPKVAMGGVDETVSSIIVN